MERDLFLQTTMRGLETGLTVGTIASSPIATCSVHDEPDEVLARPEWSDYDALPVADGNRIIAVVERNTGSRRPLDSSILVSADQPLEEFLKTHGLVQDGYRLVIFGGKIEGIVTPSDLLRLPVRVLAFALLSHLEMTMVKIIDRHNIDTEQWLHIVSEERKEELLCHQETLRRHQLNPNMLEFTYMSEKLNVLKCLKLIPNSVATKASGLNELRNQIAHNRDYVRSSKDLNRFLRRMERLPILISTFECIALGRPEPRPE